tara:strand:+ start:476 stop:613 length:138 start_codon:yes stop_codon:yes gene_type:complete
MEAELKTMQGIMQLLKQVEASPDTYVQLYTQRKLKEIVEEIEDEL